MRPTRLLVLPLVVLVALGAGGCGRGVVGDTAGRKPRVVAAFYPLAWAAVRVGGARVAVTDLTPPGVEPHDLELAPRAVAGIASSNLLLYVGDAFQPSVQAAAPDAGGRAVDVAGAVASDPHVWLDPRRMESIVRITARSLRAADPVHAGTYSRRAAATRRVLVQLDDRYRRALGHCARRDIVTSHAAFGYLAARYGLRQVAIAQDPEAEPPPGSLARIADLATRTGATTIFAERLGTTDLASTIASEVGAATAVLDPIESRPSSGGYLGAMKANLRALAAALGCR